MNFNSVYSPLLSKSLPVLIVGAVLVALFLWMLLFFLIPAVVHFFRLREVQRRIARFNGNNSKAEQFEAVFSRSNRLSHLWREYRESLHVPTEERGGRHVELPARATVPAEMFFSTQAVVDTWLSTEFYKHFPAIFTGIGIIGTFTGLVNGLEAFQVSENAATVRASLESLMHAVGDAFEVSAAAIIAAMLMTFVEKLLLSVLYRKTEDIAHKIDGAFEAGAGEEYLSRLVKASEASATNSKQLKDTFVSELQVILEKLTESQIQAYQVASQKQMEAVREDSQRLGQTIAESIQQSLKAPLDDIASAVRTASGDQSATAARMLQDVMASFSQRLNDLFGGQISGLNELNQQTARSIQEAVGTLQTLIANLEASSQRSSEAMAQRMAEAVEKMEARQEAMNTQSAAFIEQIRSLVASSQSETNQKLQATLETIGTQVAGMLGALAESQKQVFDNNREREQSMADRTRNTVSAMTESVETVLKEVSVASAKMADSVAALTQATTGSIDKMNAGAELLGTASRNFSAAGERVSNVMGQAANVTTKLSEVSGQLTSSSTALQTVIKDYQAQREAVERLVGELRATVEAARRDASMTSDVLTRIQAATQALSEAQKRAEDYLAGISAVLGEAHQRFGDAVRENLDRSNHDFQQKITTSVKQLSGLVDALHVTLSAALDR